MVENTKQSINERFIKTLKSPTNTAHKIYWDDKITGFGVRITQNSVISFVLRYVINGRERKYTIGGYPAFSSIAAKEIAVKLKGDVAKGMDPLAIKQDIYRCISFESLTNEYVEYCGKVIREKTLKLYKNILKNYIIPKFGKCKINTIKNRDIEAFHLSLKDKLHTANRILELLSVIFEYAIKHDIISVNPAKKIKKFTEEKRERYLSDDEMKAIIQAIQNNENLNARAIELLLLTGSRKNEILKAEWEQFDFSKNIWIKPASFTKQKKRSIVVLNSYTLEILNQMKESINTKDSHIISTEKYLFFNTLTKKPLGDIKRFFANICTQFKIENLRIHDLRHTFASILVSGGVSLEKTGSLIGHSNSNTTQRYAHLSNQSLFDASEVASDKIKSLIKKTNH